MTQTRSEPEAERVAAGTPAVATAPLSGGRPPGRPLDRNLTEGSIPKNLWFLAWPATVSGGLHTIDLLIEFVWAGFLGAAAIGGIGVAQTWVQIFNTGRTGLDAATRAMISRAVGAGDIPRANHIATQSLVLNGAIAIVLMALGLIFGEFLLSLLGVSKSIIAQGVDYIHWRFISTTTFTVLMTTMTTLQAAGDPITPMKANVLSRILHMVISPFLIFGWGMEPMGISGSAAGFAIAQVIGVNLCFYKLFGGRARVQLSFKNLRPDFPLYWRMLKLGAPASVTNGERALAQLVIVGIVAPFGDLVIAAYSLSQRIQMFINLGQTGLGQAAGVLVGQNLGAKQVERARTTVGWAILYCVAVTTVLGGVMFIFPEWVLRIFSRDDALVQATVPWLQIMVVGFLAMGVGDVFMQVFNTAGDTMVPMVVSLVSIWFIQQPAALILSGRSEVDLFGLSLPLPAVHGLGDLGIAWAIVAAIIIRLFFYVPYYQWGPWWKRRVY